MKNIDILAIVNAYTARKEAVIKKEAEDFKLPVAVAWKRRLNMEKLIAAKNIIDKATRESMQEFLDDEHSTANADGSRQIKPEYMQEVMRIQSELLEQETDVDIQKIGLSEIGDIALSDSDLDTLAFMIREGE